VLESVVWPSKASEPAFTLLCARKFKGIVVASDEILATNTNKKF
jgi:hypothetical protein